MKKNILIFGSLSGLIVSIMIVFTAIQCYHNRDFSGNMLMGYTFMLLAFSFVFVGIKNYRDKFNNGLITFGKAFKIGVLIAAVGSTFYVISWLIAYYFFVPDFMDKLAEYTISNTKNTARNAAEVAEKVVEMESFKAMYKNPLLVILFTYLEVFPVGLIVSVISALVLRKKPL